jgi:hypothetical protein
MHEHEELPMPGETGPTLDDEGIPDLAGPLPEKELTGDPQEGLMPPGDRAHVESDWGITGDERNASEPFDVRVRHERPDLGETDPLDDVVRDLGLDDPLPEDGGPADQVGFGTESGLTGAELVAEDILEDEEAEVVATVVGTDPLHGETAEEAAMHLVTDNDLT